MRAVSASRSVRRLRTGLWLGLCVCAVGALPLQARAAEWALSAGASFNGSLGSADWAPVGYLDVAGERRAFKAITWQTVGSLGWVRARDDLPEASYDRNVWVAGLGLRANIAHGLFGSFQLGYASDTTPAVSSHPQFITTFGWEHRKLQLSVRHISNGKLFDGPNRGETMLLAGWRLR